MTDERLIERFWAKVERGEPEQCWLWNACLDACGYGRMTAGGRVQKAHRLSLLIHGRLMPFPGALALHSCDTPNCVNPGHLYWGSQTDNMQDRARRLRHPMAKMTPEIVREARNSPLSDRELARKHGLLRERIRDARLGRTWGHVA